MSKNPFKKETFNLTEQLEILQYDPEKVDALKGATFESIAKLNPWLYDYLNLTAQIMIFKRSPDAAEKLKAIADEYLRSVRADETNAAAAMARLASRMAELNQDFAAIAQSVYDEINGKGGEE